MDFRIGLFEYDCIVYNNTFNPFSCQNETT